MKRTANPLIPMGAITGRPTREQLIENLEHYRKAGIGHFLIYPRSGLEVEYMGPEWIEICRVIIEYCAANDMGVWLYDEYNWPSGKCKGKVIRADSAFSSRKLVAFADRNFCGVENPEAPAAEYFWTEMSIPLYADLLNPDAVECFINLTHEVYYRHFKEYFGSTVKGIFSDEPSFMYACFQSVRGSSLEVPCYAGLREEYRGETGRELIGDFEAFLRGNPPEQLWETVYSLFGRRFRSVYFDRVRNWCQDRGIQFTGHLMSEPHPPASIAASGDPVMAMRSFSMPGLDEICTRYQFETIEWNTFKLLESAMHGPRRDALAELFALGPADMTFTTMRCMIYLAALHGVNYFVTAVSALDARGNVEKSLYYNPVAPTQPHFRYLAQLGEEAAVAAGLAGRRSTAAIALRYPQQLYCRERRRNGEAVLPIPYTELVKALIDAQWEFRVIGDDEAADPSFKAILSLTAEGAAEERSNSSFRTIEEVTAHLESSLTRRKHLRFAGGRPVERILLKSFDDGSVCILNTSGEPLRNVTLGAEQFDLAPYEAALFPRPEPVRLQNLLDLGGIPMRGEPDRANSLRCAFSQDGELEIDAADPVEVVFALREYAGKVELSLDGQAITTDGESKRLPYGIGSLYHESAPFLLEPGKHRLRLTNAAGDLPYLPSAFLLGNFALGQDRRLRQLPAEAATVRGYFENNLAEYAGTVLFRAELDLTGKEGVSFEFRGLPVELTLGGKALGARLWAPFEWEIPEELRRPGVLLQLKVTTSVAPLFGKCPEYPNPMLTNWWPKAAEDFIPARE